MKTSEPDYLKTDIPGLSARLEGGEPQGIVTNMEDLLHYLKFNPGPVTARILKLQTVPRSTLLCGLEEVAAYAGVSIRTVRNWVRARGLSLSRPRNELVILQEDLDAFIHENSKQFHGHDGHHGQVGQNNNANNGEIPWQPRRKPVRRAPSQRRKKTQTTTMKEDR